MRFEIVTAGSISGSGAGRGAPFLSREPNERQSTLFEQRRATNLPSGTPDVPQYVYQELPFDYPVMAAVADQIGRAHV